MLQMSFTAEDLFCMAYVQKKRKMYGIPNAMGPNPEKKIQETIDSLLAKELAVMDLDGKVSLCRDYVELVNCYCDCRKCLTINLHKEEQTEQNWILWQYNGQYTIAEAVADRYVFSKVEETVIRARLEQALYRGNCCRTMPEAVIPQNQMVKAKRLCADKKQEDAIRLLQQNGAPEETACVITDGLLENAYYLGILYMDLQQSQCQKSGKAFLAGRGVLLALDETVLNLRTCATFTPTDLEQMHADVSGLIEAFLEKGAAV